MALPNRDAERLDHALDAGSQQDANGTVSDLIGTFHRLQAMNAQITGDATLRTDIWSRMMNVSSPRPSGLIGFPASTPSADFAAPLRPPRTARRRRAPVWFSAAIILLIFSVAAGIYFPGRSPEDESVTTILAPQLAESGFLGPNIADCTTQAREPGTVVALAGQQATVRPFLPRSGFDPAFESIDQPNLRSNAVDGSIVLAQTQGLSALDPGIEVLLDQLFACSPYGYPVERQQPLDSRYYALFTEDFFRREFSGYLEAGLEPRLTGGWFPFSKPVLLDARQLDNRVILILEGRREIYDLLVVKEIDGSWFVDEVGSAEMPDGWDKAPVATPTETTGDIPPGPYESDFVLRSVSELPAPDESTTGVSTLCDQFPEASGARCGYIMNFGPYDRSAYPPNVSVTLAFSNVSDVDMRIEIPGLGVTLDVPSGHTEATTINGDPGKYIVLVYGSGSQNASQAMVIEVNQPGASYPMG